MLCCSIWGSQPCSPLEGPQSLNHLCSSAAPQLPLFPRRAPTSGLSSHPGRLPFWLDPPQLGERLSVPGTIFPALAGLAHNSLWSLGSHWVTTASQMWPIWNLLLTQPVQTRPVAAARAPCLSVLTSEGQQKPEPPSLSSPFLAPHGQAPPLLLCPYGLPHFVFLTESLGLSFVLPCFPLILAQGSSQPLAVFLCVSRSPWPCLLVSVICLSQRAVALAHSGGEQDPCHIFWSSAQPAHLPQYPTLSSVCSHVLRSQNYEGSVRSDTVADGCMESRIQPGRLLPGGASLSSSDSG